MTEPSEPSEPFDDPVFAALDSDEFELYDDIDDVPVDAETEDELPEPDGDDYALGDHPEGLAGVPHVPPGAPLTATGHPLPPLTRRRVVPFTRTLKRGMSGRDVRAVQRALAVAQREARRPLVPARTAVFGRWTYRALRDFQRRKGLEVDGQYGKQTHRKLAPFFDARGIELMRKAKANQEKLSDPVARAESAAIFLYNNRHLIGYTQGPSRMWMVRNGCFPPCVPRYEDCSSGVTGLYCYARVPDPNGGTAYTGSGRTLRRRSNPQGYTGTQAPRGRRVSGFPRCALVFYGRGRISHVTMVVGTKGRCWSHGSSSGPLILPVRYRGDVVQVNAYPGMPK